MLERRQLGGGRGRLEIGDREFRTGRRDRGEVDADLLPRFNYGAFRLAFRAVTFGGSGHVDASATEVIMTSGVHSGDGLVSITYVSPGGRG